LITKSITKKHQYIAVFLLLIILILAKHFFIQTLISNQEESANLVNIAGRQRMLSQKITKDALLIARNQTPREFEYYSEDLKKSLEEFQEAHLFLTQRENDEEITKMFNELETYFNNIVTSGNQILENRSDFQLIPLEAEEIRRNEFFFLLTMDDIAFHFDKDTTKAISDIRNIDNVFMALIILLSLVLTTIIIKPISETMKKSFLEIHENSTNIMRMFNTMKNPLFLINKEGEIISVNKEGKKLVNQYDFNENKNNISKNIDWVTINIKNVIKNINAEGRTEECEGTIKDPEGKELYVSVSGFASTYKGEEVIFIALNDFTVQKKAEEQIREIATKDGLTGLYNRRYLDMIVEEEIERAERYDIPLSIFILDLDHFKIINDDWGHPVGDTVLKQTAEIVLNNIRLSDIPLRIGGEEFLVLMPHTNLEGAKQAAEKLRNEIEMVIHPVVGKYTASFGVAERRRGETYHNLYQNADSALYKAKNSGRNRVESFIDENSESVSLYWKDAWNCGEETIDNQHKELFMMSSKLLENYILTLDKEEALKYLAAPAYVITSLLFINSGYLNISVPHCLTKSKVGTITIKEKESLFLHLLLRSSNATTVFPVPVGRTTRAAFFPDCLPFSKSFK
jgi:diguanylate cyclase (GGDEF)-like protein